MKKQNNQTRPSLVRLRLLGAAAAVIISLGLTAQAQVPVFSTVWSITNASFPDLPASGDTVRGMAISPLTTNVVFASRSNGTNNGVNHVSTLDIANGYNFLGQGRGTGITGGTLALIGARVSDDGYVYANNLTAASNSFFKVYRWPSDTDFTTDPQVVYNSANEFTNTAGETSFKTRMGDYMDLRGSGADTEIVLVGFNSTTAGVPPTTNFVILRATDSQATNFTSKSYYLTNVNVVNGGVTFEGTNNVIYVRDAANNVRRVSYDTNANTATILSSFTLNDSSTRGLKYVKTTNGLELLATVQVGIGAAATNTTGGRHTARVFRITSPTTAVQVYSEPLPAAWTNGYSRNDNGLGLVDYRHEHFVFSEPNNGILLTRLTGYIVSQPTNVVASGGGIFVEGWPGPVTVSVTASGTDPLAYQWYKDDGLSTNSIGGATTNSYSLGAADLADNALYFCVITNLYGSATSGVAGVTVLPGAYSNVASNLWTVASGSRPYLTTTGVQRGLAYHALSNLVLVVSQTPSPSNMVALLDANTGADVGSLDTSLINAPANPTPDGFFDVNMVGVADDGVVYVGNMILSGASDNFVLYRWQDADPATLPSQAYSGNPAIARLGDTMAVRGSGVNTEILCSFRTSTNVCLFTTSDGFTFTPTVIPVVNLPEDAQDTNSVNGFAGLGLAFGAGNTFWAKSSSYNLRQVSYDTNTATATVIQTFTNLTATTEAPLGVDSVNGLVATVAYGQTPHNLSLWDVSGGQPVAKQVDRELFASNNANGNGTGAVAFDVAGGRIFALDSNNGLLAATYAPKVFINRNGQGGIVTWSGPGTLQSAPVVTGPYTDVLGASSPYTNSAADQIYFRVRR